MNGMKADPDAVRELGTQILAATQASQECLKRLHDSLDTLSRQWSGDAQQAYIRAQTKWLTDMAALSTIAKAAADYTREWALDLEALEGDLASGWPGR